MYNTGRGGICWAGRPALHIFFFSPPKWVNGVFGLSLRALAFLPIENRFNRPYEFIFVQ